MATIIDGKAIAAKLRDQVATEVTSLRTHYDLTPGIAVVLVGENPASQVYVRNKVKQAKLAGMDSIEHRLPATTTQTELLELVRQLNDDPKVNGILVQLPLPSQISEDAVIAAIKPDKDVDGFHLHNVGLLHTGGSGLVPCTPLGSMLLIEQSGTTLTGKHAVVLGRSNIVGKPMAALLLDANCTVTVAHSRTQDLPSLCREADILVAAVGRPEMVQGDWIKPGATVIDVGINRIEADAGKTRLVGDVDFLQAREVAGAITPVPGGVGPMTIACLLKNTVTATCLQQQIPRPV